MQELARIQIDASPEAVFDLLADNTRRGEWAEGMETFDYTSDFDPDDPVGTTFTQRIREGGRVTEYHGEITAYDPPTSGARRCPAAPTRWLSSITSPPSNGGTQVVNVCDVNSSSWFFRVMGVLFGWFTRYLGRKQLRKLKELVEAA